MGNQSFYLFQLQKIDRRLDQIGQRIGQIETQINNSEVVTTIRGEFDSSVGVLNDLNRQLGAVEQKAAEKRVKIEISESSLYGGKVQNPKELADLQQEIASLKLNLKNLENEQFDLMVGSEEQQAVVDKKKLALDQALEKNLTDNQQLFAEKNALLAEISKTNTERAAITQQINPESLSLYESLKKAKKGFAVAGIEEQCCTACGSQLTPAECQRAKSSSQITLCPSCGRILYAD